MADNFQKLILRPTEADEKIQKCLDTQQSFAVIAGAGSGKTTSLVEALGYVRDHHGTELRQNGQQVVCITFTKRAVAVISSRLGFDELFHVSTLHSFLWGIVGRFQNDIREALEAKIIPDLIEKTAKRDNGGQSKAALKARAKVEQLKSELDALSEVETFRYDDTGTFSNFADGQIGHDDMIDLSAYLISEKSLLRRGLGSRYPYIFIDEAQDTFDHVLAAFNATCADDGLPLVGYFGDPMQQIYDNGTGVFSEGVTEIAKKENFRSAKSVIRLLNSFRDDVMQVPAGPNADVEGTVHAILVQAETPGAPRKRYLPEQLDRNLVKFDAALEHWNWTDNIEAKRLFLVRQMIARRLGFTSLHSLFTGSYASSAAQSDYEDGTHFLLRPFVSTLCPLMEAHLAGNNRKIIEILNRASPAFEASGKNSDKSLKAMLEIANSSIENLSKLWGSSTTKNILEFSRKNELCKFSPRLDDHLNRAPRNEEYDDDLHSADKSDWLSDAFFQMQADELQRYCDFVEDNTPFSTQHGSKGEEYDDVLVVFDDIEAAWSQYSFTKLLTPATSGDATDGQRDKSRKLAYVCFSRAKINLRVLLFTEDASAAHGELISSGLFAPDQIEILTQ